MISEIGVRSLQEVGQHRATRILLLCLTTALELTARASPNYAIIDPVLAALVACIPDGGNERHPVPGILNLLGPSRSLSVVDPKMRDILRKLLQQVASGNGFHHCLMYRNTHCSRLSIQ